MHDSVPFVGLQHPFVGSTMVRGGEGCYLLLICVASWLSAVRRGSFERAAAQSERENPASDNLV
jgi:hypothetical protein